MANVLFFAAIKEKLQRESLEIPANIETIAQLKKWLESSYPDLRPDLERAMWAKNEEFVAETEPIEANDTIACITPVSGG